MSDITKTYKDFEHNKGAQSEEEGQIENHGFEAGIAAANLLIKSCADDCDKAWSAFYDWRDTLEVPKNRESHLVMYGLIEGVDLRLSAIVSARNSRDNK